MLDLKRMGEKKYQTVKNTSTSNKETQFLHTDDINSGVILDSKKTNPNLSNFRVKNSTKINSNAFLDKSASMMANKSSANLLNNYDDMGFSKLKSLKNKMENQTIIEGLKFLSFDIEDIKLRYIFPFNDNFKRKSNFKLEDTSNIIHAEDPKIVYEWNVFHFPFTQAKLSLMILKELQTPIDAKMSDIQNFLNKFS